MTPKKVKGEKDMVVFFQTTHLFFWKFTCHVVAYELSAGGFSMQNYTPGNMLSFFVF